MYLNEFFSPFITRLKVKNLVFAAIKPVLLRFRKTNDKIH